ncbi:MAG: hypothetical protein HONBIEJF_02282 [Fimbriimonadaceae bacterium]|nr:hypothetical protein [Fimbriimonadaceae bacterium]
MRVSGVRPVGARWGYFCTMMTAAALAGACFAQDFPSTWGENKYGTLGRGSNNDQWLPGTPVGLTDVAMMAGGGYHTLYLKKDGTVWSAGNNLYGELGLGNNTDKNVPTQVAGLSNIKFVGAGTSHSFAIDANGLLYAWGRNTNGQLGDGTNTHRKSPVLVVGIPPVKSVSGGEFHSAAVTTTGQVWSWGQNTYGQLGNGTNLDSTVPLPVNLVNIVKVSAGYQHTLAMSGKGEVYAWGNNLNGQLGNGTTKNSNIPLYNNRMDRATDICARKTSLALRADNTVWEWGGVFNGKLIPVVVDGLYNIVSVSIGTIHTMALQADGRLWCWGNNPDGQLGTGNTQGSSFPTQAQISNVNWIYAGGYHSAATTGELPSRTVRPFDRTFFLGQLAGGTMGSLFSDDDDRFRIARHSGTGTSWAVEVWYYMFSPNPSPSSVKAQVSASTSLFGMIQEISAFDYNSFTWVVVDSRMSSMFDITTTVSLPGDQTRFVSGADNEMRLRVRYRNPMISPNPWEARVDKAVYIVK